MSDFDLVPQLLSMSDGARLLMADLHVHTPASKDMASAWAKATPDDIVSAAIAARLDIIAVTDHNTVEWCAPVVKAAVGTDLTVFPGVEISTKHGHLVAVFDPDHDVQAIRELLIRAGFSSAQFGDLNAASDQDMDVLAGWIDEAGGVAIAAHVDSAKGLMSFAVDAERRRVFASTSIRALEVSDAKRRNALVAGKQKGYERRVACVMSSDCWPDGGSAHNVDAVGRRHCYLKMDERSVHSLKQAFLDPEVRVRFCEDDRIVPETVIEAMSVTGGFLNGQSVRFSDNLTCFIGATGAGKSLVIELLRFALMQQANIPKIRTEVDSLLQSCFGPVGTVRVLVRKGADRYVLERQAVQGSTQFPTSVHRVGRDSLEELPGIDPATFFAVKAYSQSEIIEFARDDAARLSLTDDLIDISTELSDIEGLKADLRKNAMRTTDAQRKRREIETAAEELPSIEEQIARLEEFLNHPRVQEHKRWIAERNSLDTATAAVEKFRAAVEGPFPRPSVPLLSMPAVDSPNVDLLKEAIEIGEKLGTAADVAAERLSVSANEAIESLGGVRGKWNARFEKEERDYEALLASIDTNKAGLPGLGKKLTALQQREATLQDMRRKATEELDPLMRVLAEERDKLLTSLQLKRRLITSKREGKAKELTRALQRRVVIDVDADANGAHFKTQLDALKTGSYLGDADIKAMAETLHPVPFVKSMLSGDFGTLGDVSGLEASRFQRLMDNIAQKTLEADLYEAQLADVRDVVRIRFAVAPGEYKDLEKLAHGQKCTVILAVAMAEGSFPMLVDQPEDALHPPYIEGNIVATLRADRGKRQYIFATRNANVVVSGDAEQVIVLDADSRTGRVERTGSIDRFSTRDLVLLHMEGGRDAFERKNAKYGLK